MRRLGQTTAQLRRFKRRWEELAALQTTASQPDSASGRLRPLDEFGSNPGNLRGFAYVPEALAPEPALVVVLHGCTQSAASYDHGAGWSALADRYGFALLFPEQQAANNAKVCFNWFQPGDIARGHGEALSIRQMVDAMVRRHGIDRRRIFVTGLSAGGAMAGVMLATYPDVFAAGAIIAGLPYGCARNVQEALDAMFQGKELPSGEWGDHVRAASPHKGPWPKLSVWHGSADTTVRAMNAREIVKQWTDVHGLPLEPSARDTVDGYPREVWTRDGETIVESYTITGMAHGTPLGAQGSEAIGHAGPFLLEAGISSSYHIARFWGLTGTQAAASPSRVAAEGAVAATSRTGSIVETTHEARKQATRDNGSPEEQKSGRLGIGSIINRALRSAGLIKD